MDVILLDKVQNLGELGDEVAVKSGYGRNFLIPRGKAVPATADNRAHFEARRQELEKSVAETLTAATARGETLAGSSVTIARKAGEEGKLFGSVGTADIAEAVTASVAAIEKHEVSLSDGALRAVGDYEIAIQLHPNVTVQVTVNVVAEA